MVLDAVVVAGGAGRRLGRDKALVDRDGRRQVDVVVEALRPLGARVVLAHGPRVLHVDETIGVADVGGLVGPLAGMVAGLRAARTEFVAVVAVDLVRPDADLLLALAHHVDGQGLAGAMPDVDGRPQPLHAVVARALADNLAAAGPRLVRAMDATGVTRIPERTWRTWSPQARPADDIDTPADLARLDLAPPPAN